MIRVAAIDDERHALERFSSLVSHIPELILDGLFDSSESLLVHLRQASVDAVFLDIEMPGGNGLDLVRHIQEISPETKIVIITAHPQYAIEAFDASALDYLLKPLTQERLNRTVQRLAARPRPAQTAQRPYFQCFGSFDVFVNGVALSWRNSKAKEVLAYLTHHVGIPLSWDRITEAIWPTFDYRQAQTNFHATMYLLRKRLREAGLQDILENSRGNYRLLPEKITSDIIEYEQQFAAGNFERLPLIARRGYMEDNGFAWAFARTMEIEGTLRKVSQGRDRRKT